MTYFVLTSLTTTAILVVLASTMKTSSSSSEAAELSNSKDEIKRKCVAKDAVCVDNAVLHTFDNVNGGDGVAFCLQRCKDTKGCLWISFHYDTSKCVLLSDCSRVSDPCQNCLSLGRDCPLTVKGRRRSHFRNYCIFASILLTSFAVYKWVQMEASKKQFRLMTKKRE